jgi:hypothetical protein
VLITKTKVINLRGHQVKVFSLDGKLWFSKPSDLAQFRHRQAANKFFLQRRFAEKMALPASPVDVDYWGR